MKTSAKDVCDQIFESFAKRRVAGLGRAFVWKTFSCSPVGTQTGIYRRLLMPCISMSMAFLDAILASLISPKLSSDSPPLSESTWIFLSSEEDNCDSLSLGGGAVFLLLLPLAGGDFLATFGLSWLVSGIMTDWLSLGS